MSPLQVRRVKEEQVQSDDNSAVLAQVETTRNDVVKAEVRSASQRRAQSLGVKKYLRIKKYRRVAILNAAKKATNRIRAHAEKTGKASVGKVAAEKKDKRSRPVSTMSKEVVKKEKANAYKMMLNETEKASLNFPRGVGKGQRICRSTSWRGPRGATSKVSRVKLTGVQPRLDARQWSMLSAFENWMQQEIKRLWHCKMHADELLVARRDRKR